MEKNKRSAMLKILSRGSHGRCKFASPVASWENIDGAWDLDADRMASRTFCSSFLAIISAAFPRGHRITGTWPAPIYQCTISRTVYRHTHSGYYTEEASCNSLDFGLDLLLRRGWRIQNSVSRVW